MIPTWRRKQPILVWWWQPLGMVLSNSMWTTTHSATPTILALVKFCGTILGSGFMRFSGSCGYTTNMNVELHAILHGLNITWEAGHKDVICKIDSLMALQLISGDDIQLHPYAAIVRKIQWFCSLAWNLTFAHFLREVNECANWRVGQESSFFNLPYADLSALFDPIEAFFVIGCFWWLPYLGVICFCFLSFCKLPLIKN